jgi:hypothetical protein
MGIEHRVIARSGDLVIGETCCKLQPIREQPPRPFGIMMQDPQTSFANG